MAFETVSRVKMTPGGLDWRALNISYLASVFLFLCGRKRIRGKVVKIDGYVWGPLKRDGKYRATWFLRTSKKNRVDAGFVDMHITIARAISGYAD